MTEISFTFDLENTNAGTTLPARYEAPTHAVLDLLAELGARGTFFVVGELAPACASLIRRIAAENHEIALHGWRHVPLGSLTHDQLRSDVKRGIATLEDISATPVVGFRAPLFSLTRNETWVPPVLQEAGMLYSSSVLPARNPISGFPGAPNSTFRWSCGLVEFPVPVTTVLKFSMPFLGGVYLRYLPTGIITRALSSCENENPWIYSHPYDFDVGEPYHRLPWTNHIVSLILHMRRQAMSPRVKRLLRENSSSLPLSEVARRFDAQPGDSASHQFLECFNA